MYSKNNTTINIYWTRHSLSCSNIATSYALQLLNCKNNYKDFKKNNLYYGKYSKDSNITNIGISHINTITDNLIKNGVQFDKIITSNLIRAIKTADKFAENLNINDIYILPFIQEINTITDGTNVRSINLLKDYLKNTNTNSNIHIFNNHQYFLEPSSIYDFINLINVFFPLKKKKIYNFLVVTHGGFFEKYISGKKVANLEIWKQKYHLKINNNIVVNKPEKFMNGVGIDRKDNYYCNPLNFSVNKQTFEHTLKECNIKIK